MRFFPTFSLIFPAFFLSFFLFFLPSVTLVTAKKQHCGWKVRAYACTRETLPENSPSTVLLILSFLHFLILFLVLPHFPFFSSGAFSTCYSTFLLYAYCRFSIEQRKNALFLDFFTLWGNIDPYTNRRERCKPKSVQIRLNTKFL